MKKTRMIFWYKDEQPPKKDDIIRNVYNEKYKVIKRDDKGKKYLLTLEEIP